ncbi:hypothetical protein [Spirulina sp. 06S082]|uniref:hypothetical protein n=1 Tax=Spirulina sp. 06S082 TaxID=3110248 RepID=UPI002B207C97|nr:hypothetical protein [Spirulina sp. 06S082]MEA5472228.1 hypothetical protein [Spirulina sp. 06S082]
MTQSETTQILEELKEIRTRLDHLDGSVNHLEKSVSHLEKSVDRLEISADKSEAYREGTQWVVNLAFSLIAATTIGIILRFVLGS